MMQRMKWLITVGLMMVLAVPGMAQSGKSEIVVYGGDGDLPLTSPHFPATVAHIGIGAFHMFTIPGPAVGISLQERERIVYTRLNEILSTGRVDAPAVHVRMVRSAPTVFVGDIRLVSVYASDARAAGVSQRELAGQWARGVAEILPVVAPASAVGRGLAIHDLREEVAAPPPAEG